MVCIKYDFINGRMAGPNRLKAEPSNCPKIRMEREQLLGLVGALVWMTFCKNFKRKFLRPKRLSTESCWGRNVRKPKCMLSEAGLSEWTNEKRWGETRYVLKMMLWTAECLGPGAKPSRGRNVQWPKRTGADSHQGRNCYAHVRCHNMATIYRFKSCYRDLVQVPDFN